MKKYEILKENENFIFFEEGGRMVSTSYAQIITDKNGNEKTYLEKGKENYRDLDKQGKFNVEDGDYILIGERRFDKKEYKIYKVELKDGEIKEGLIHSFDQSSAAHVVTPKLTKAFKALVEKMNNPLLGIKFFKEK